MALVLDASVTASWYFPDEDNPAAYRALQIVRREGGLVPLHWWFELRNAFLIGERRSRLSTFDTAEALKVLDRLRIEYAPLPEHPALFALARKHRLTFYDAAYLELAQRENIPLATLDDDLAAAARAEDVRLIGSTE